MAEDWSDSRREFEKAQARLDAALERVRVEMDAAREQFERAVERGTDPLKAAVKYRDRFGGWPDSRFWRKRRPRRGRDLEGGEPVPVKPRPKPTPLMDGAEAPIE